MTVANEGLGTPAPGAPVSWHRLADKWNRVPLLSVALVTILAALVVPPLAILLYQSLHGPTGAEDWSVANYIALISDPQLPSIAFNSIVFAFLSTALSLVVGCGSAFLVERTNTPMKGTTYLVAITSLGTPYVLYVTAWLFLFGRAGPFNSFYRSVTGDTDILLNVYSLWGMVLIEGFLWSPLVFLMLAGVFRAANGDMEDAARMSGGSMLYTMRKISFALARPAIIAVALIVFIRNLETFEVPALVGMPARIRLIITDIYFSVAQIPQQLGHASAFSVVLLAITSLLLVVYSRFSRDATKYASITGKSFRPRQIDLGPWRWLAGSLLLANSFLVLGLPILALLWVSCSPFPQAITLNGFKLLTLKHYAAVLQTPAYFNLGVNTLIVAASTATIVIAFTVFCGWVAARRKAGGIVIDQLVTAPIIFPGIVLGVAVLQIGLRLPVHLYGTIWLIVFGLVTRYMPYGMRYSYSGVLQIHKELEEAGSVAGASQPGVLRRIIVPLLAPSLIPGWLFIFLIAARELPISILLASPNAQTMAVGMYDLWTNGQAGELAALGLVWAALVSLIAMALYYLSRNNSAATFG